VDARAESEAEAEAAAPNLGLRERNKRRAMLQIQDAALDLFDRDGFTEVTVEQIAAADGVSPSTVYRYFGANDRIILHDEDDRVMVETLVAAAASGASLIEAARRALAVMRPRLGADNQSLRRRFRYMFDEPAVAAAMARESQATAEQLAAALCRVRGRPPGDPEIALGAACLMAAVLLAGQMWRRGEFAADLGQLLQRFFDQLESGIAA
jgi:AcrR family transcriptional regulator